MHTFFINTSQKSLNEYDILFDIHYENKTFVSMDCKISEWHNAENGYLACIKKMSEMIDGYSELSNAFNLIIYIDLAENKVYSEIPREAMSDIEREACLRAMHMLYSNAIGKSVVKELEDSGRKPQSVLIMFGEDKKFVDFSRAENNPGEFYIEKYLFKFLGLPEDENIETIAKEVLASDASDKTKAFEEKIMSMCSNGLMQGIHESYAESLHFWCDDIICSRNIENARKKQVERMKKENEHGASSVKTVSCPYDRYACLVNRSELALKQINLAVYLLRCIEKKTIFVDEKYDDVREKKVAEFRAYTLDEIARNLRIKKKIFSQKAEDILSTTKSYCDMKLVPELMPFDNLKFGLDEYGGKAFELVVSDAENNESDSSKDGSEPIVSQTEKNVEVKEKSGKYLLKKDEFRLFDYKFDDSVYQMNGDNISADEYIEQAKKVRVHHLNYLKKLRVHVSEALSNYAGKSMQNKPALLQMGGYRYTKKEVGETKPFEAVKTVSDKAYETMMNQYMEFCAGRSVEITDIEEQCNWFVSRICQIEESLGKIKKVAIGLMAALVALYIPYFIIQFESLTKSVMTFAVALASVAIPVALLYGVFAIVSAKQKQKFREVWIEFKNKSDEALEENSKAALKYDQLLAVIIPALRWVYEYKLDISHYNDCCNIADAKVEHHRRKLRDRVDAISNILVDLEISDDEFVSHGDDVCETEDVIDYNVSFCSGKNNVAFYSVFDNSFFERFKS